MKGDVIVITALLLAALGVSFADGAVNDGDAAFTCDYQAFSRSDKQDSSFGDLFEISGQNTVSPYTYLMLQGPGIPEEGTPLTNPTEPGAVDLVAVRADGSWNFTWDSADLYSHGRNWFAPGTYQIVASADATHRVIRNVVFERSYIVGRLKTPVVVEGEDVVLSGWAYPLQTPQHLYIWIFGPSYASYGTVVTLDQEGYYEFALPTLRIAHVTTGAYQILVQHPMQDRQQDARVMSGTVVHLPGDEGLPEGQDVDLAQRAPEDAVRMLATSLRSEYCDRDDPCDDAYIHLQFSIASRDSPPIRGVNALAYVVPPVPATATTTATVIPTTTVTVSPSPTPAPPTATTTATPASPIGAASVIAAGLLILVLGRTARRR